MTHKEAHVLLAKQACEIDILAEQMNVSLNCVRFFVNNSKEAGYSWVDGHVMRMPFTLLMMLDVYAYVFGHISETQLKKKYSEYCKLNNKFSSSGEYTWISKDDGDKAHWRHMSLRPARLLPQY